MTREHDDALADAADATVRLVLAIHAWQDALDRLGNVSRIRDGMIDNP